MGEWMGKILGKRLGKGSGSGLGKGWLKGLVRGLGTDWVRSLANCLTRGCVRDVDDWLGWTLS